MIQLEEENRCAEKWRRRRREGEAATNIQNSPADGRTRTEFGL